VVLHVPLVETDTLLSATELSARTYDGLIPTVCHDPRFRRIMDYRYYPLHRRSDRYDLHIASKVSRCTRQMEASFKLRFDGSDHLAVLQFMNAFVECSEVKSHLRSHLLTPVTRLYTQHTNRHPEVASGNTMGEGDGCKGKQDL
jgi:hypothetical protein